MNRTEETKTDHERVAVSLAKFENALACYKDAKDELVRTLREEYAKAFKIPQNLRLTNRCVEIHVSTGLALSWVSQVLTGKRDPKKPESVLAIARFFATPEKKS